MPILLTEVLTYGFAFYQSFALYSFFIVSFSNVIFVEGLKLKC